MNDGVPRHPEAQKMAAFVDGTLSAPEVAAIAEHLRGCGDCRTVVSETARFTDEEEPHVRSNWWMSVAAVLAVAIVAATVIMLRRSPIDRLIAFAPHEHRLVEARLSGFPWARLQAPSRGEAKPDTATLKFSGAAGDVLESKDTHAKGVAYLVIGRRNDSIEALERAAEGSNDPKVWNDLAVARLASAVADDHPSQLPEALADADHALRLDPRFAEALFNRALILEHLGILAAARKAWIAYLAVDPNSEWSAEARAHLHKLSGISRRFDPKMFDAAPVEQVVREFPEETRRYGEAMLLPGQLDRARAIGDALAAFKGERLLQDAVAAVERSAGASRQALAEAYREYNEAGFALKDRNAGVAEAHFRRAAELFRQGGSPMADSASYHAASAAFQQHRASAREELGHLLGSIDREHHRALAAQIEWELALAANTEADWGTAARIAEHAIDAFRGLGERHNAASVGGIAAISYEMMGERDVAWERRTRTCAELSTLRFPASLATMVHAAMFTLLPLDQTAAASALLNTILSDPPNDPLVRAEMMTSDVRLAARADDVQHARSELPLTRRAAADISDPALRESVQAQIDLVAAEIQFRSAPNTAIQSLGRSISLFQNGRLSWLLPEAHLQRGRAYRASANDDAAVAEYTAAMQAIETQESAIRDTQRRLAFRDTAARVIDETIDIELARGRIAEAFAFVDRSRALDDRRHLPGNTSDTPVIEYVVRPHAITIFCLAHDGVSVQSVAMERPVLTGMVDAFAEDVRRRAVLDDLRSESATLYRLLIAPVKPHLGQATEIVLIPDHDLYAVPFPALWDETEKRYLVEQRVIRFAPSAAASAGPANDPISPALVIADPPTMHQPRLSAGLGEASSIATRHGAVFLAGEAATRTSFMELARSSALIHFAGHANSDPAESYGSLAFAASSGDSGLLSSDEIAQLPLERHPLVVLAACGTFRGNAAHVAGMSSLARSFLIAGARGVVGTLWEIDDDLSAPLFTRFHRQLSAGVSPARALRDAQFEMLHSRDPLVSHPATWAPVELFGNV